MRLSTMLSFVIERLATRSSQRPFVALASLVALLGIAGCSDMLLKPGTTSPERTVGGTVFGGNQAISGAAITLYAVGTTGDGSPSTVLATATALTPSGTFTLPSGYCGSGNPYVYLTATGGDAGSGPNPNISYMVALGPCLSIPSSITVNELTTVAAVYALAPFMHSYTAVGSGTSDVGVLQSEFAVANQLASDVTGAAGTGTGVPTTKIDSLGNILASCVNSTGGAAGDSNNPCGSLFVLATPQPGTPPIDLANALLNIANNPTNQVEPLFLISQSNTSFGTGLTSPPSDWSLAITSSTPSPTFNFPSGNYASSINVTLTASNPRYFITNPTGPAPPSTSSTPYTVPITVAAGTTDTIWAIAYNTSTSTASIPVVATYTVNTGITAPSMTGITPSSVTVLPGQVVPFTATFSTGTSVSVEAVTWSLNPAIGTISSSGVYNAPATITSSTSVTVTAVSVVDAAVTATATISLTPSSGQAYYVSPSGSDTNAGTTQGSPWKTIAKVNSQDTSPGFSPGDSILFQAGNTWNEQLTLTSKGSATAPIRIGSYGSGAAPIISGGNTLTGWASETSNLGLQQLCNATATPSATTVSCTADPTVLGGGPYTNVGSLLVVHVYTSGPQTTMPLTITDSIGNTFSAIPTENAMEHPTSNWLQTFIAPANKGTGTDTFTATVGSADAGTLTIVVSAWDGADIPSPLDGSSVAVGTVSGTSLNSGPADGSSGNTNDLVVGACIGANSLTHGTGETAIYGSTPQPSGPYVLIENEFGAATAAAQCSQASGLWAASVSTFRPASAYPATLHYASYANLTAPSTTIAPWQVFKNGVRLKQNLVSKGTLVTGQWWLDQTNSRVYLYDDPGTNLIEIDQRQYAIKHPCGGTTNYLTINGIQVQETSVQGVYVCTGQTTVAQFVTINNYEDGLRFDQARSGTTVAYSTAARNGDRGFSFDDTPGLVASNLTAYKNTALTKGWASPTSTTGVVLIHEFSAGIKIEPAATDTNEIVEYSTAYENGLNSPANWITGSGIWADTQGDGLIFRYNTSYDNNNRGIDIDHDNNAMAYNNIVYNNVGIGITAYADAGTSMYGNQIFNNTVWGNLLGGIRLQGPSKGSTINGCYNNSVTNNIVGNSGPSGVGPELQAQFGCENDGTGPGSYGYGNTYNYNGFGTSGGSQFIEWGAGTYYTLYGAWETAAGNCGTTHCTHSMTSDPSLTSPSMGVFTLQPGSLAIGQGVGGVDLGAIPFVP